MSSQNVLNTYPYWLHYFNSLDSTNNYASRLIEDGLAQHGEVIWAGLQTAGRGQRGKTWEAAADQNVTMSLIIAPPKALQPYPFLLNILTSLTLATYFKIILPENEICIKWPNDIYINDKKTAGILTENVFRGMQWTHAVIGMGINVNQTDFPENLNKATSLKNSSGKDFEFLEIITDLRNGLLNQLRAFDTKDIPKILEEYNRFLYKIHQSICFEDAATGMIFEATVLGVDEKGELILEQKEGITRHRFGTIKWLL